MSAGPTMDADLIWHELECGAYVADLDLWSELAAASGGPILDLGCGSGRVALHLARLGHEVAAVDIDPLLCAEVERRAASAGVSIDVTVADATELDLERSFGLVLAPMQLVQMMPGPEERSELLGVIRKHLSPGGRAALAMVEPDIDDEDAEAPLPDVREVDGWIFSSLPVAILDAGERITVRRLRQTVSPAGDLTDEVDDVVICVLTSTELEAEASRAGLSAAERRVIPPTDDHVGSTVVVLEA